MNIDYEIKTDNDGIDFEEVAEILEDRGYDVYNIDGGYASYIVNLASAKL